MRRQIESYVFRHSDLAVAGSQDVEDVLRLHGYKKEIRRIPLAIDPVDFPAPSSPASRDELRDQLGLQQITIGYIGRLAREKGVRAAAVIAVGGADEGSRLIVGPAAARAKPIVPVEHVLDGVHEVTGTGTLFPDAEGNPELHMHMACGRGGKTVAGCIRQGVKVWHVMEVIVMELLDSTGVRTLDQATGFKLLQP